MQSLNDMARYKKEKLENDSRMNLFIYTCIYLYYMKKYLWKHKILCYNQLMHITTVYHHITLSKRVLLIYISNTLT